MSVLPYLLAFFIGEQSVFRGCLLFQIFDDCFEGVRDAILPFNSTAPLMRLLSAVAFSARAFILECQYIFIMEGFFQAF